jgi:hypothetical protein
MEPPDGIFPGIVGMEAVVARNARAAVFLGSLAVYPDGVELDVRVLTADDSLTPMLSPIMLRHRRFAGTPEAAAEEIFRFGVEFSDSRKAINGGQLKTNVADRSSRGGEPEGPVLLGRGGRGGGSEWRRAFWLWPLPPAGPLSFVCEWPAAGIPVSRVEIDGQVVVDAAARATVVFPGREDDSHDA